MQILILTFRFIWYDSETIFLQFAVEKKYVLLCIKIILTPHLVFSINSCR